MFLIAVKSGGEGKDIGRRMAEVAKHAISLGHVFTEAGGVSTTGRKPNLREQSPQQV